MKKIASILLVIFLPVVISAQTAEFFFQKGDDYFFGKNNVTRSYGMAAIWYRKAAELGHPVAQYNLGKIHQFGYGFSIDYDEALKWYLKSAKQGHAEAQYSLGEMYMNGLSVKQDYKEALKWYQKSAAQSNVHAMRNIGLLYEAGHGVKQNYQTAKRWYKMAVEKDPYYTEAIASLLNIEKKISEQVGNNNNYAHIKIKEEKQKGSLTTSTNADNVDSVMMKKKQLIKKVVASTDLEYDKEWGGNGILIISEFRKSYRSSSKPIYFIKDKTPIAFSNFYNSRLYSSKEWDKYQEKKAKQYSDESFSRLMSLDEQMNGDLSDIQRRQLHQELVSFIAKEAERIYLPNYKIAFLNNLNSEGIQSDDLPLVLETLEELVDPTKANSNQGSDKVYVDEDIPIIYQKNLNTYAVIIANEEYEYESNVEFAKNDGMIFKKYCQLLFGVPDTNIHYVQNATLNDFIYETDWLNDISNAYKGDANILFYYAGLGYSGELDGRAYLLPVDGTGKNLRTCMGVEELYEMFASLPVQKVTVFLDAGFSGVNRNGTSLTAACGETIRAKQITPQGNVIVFCAAKDDEVAYSYKSGGHGLFTYFLLRKIKETSGDVTYGELSRYIQDRVAEVSIKENGKKQTPYTISSSSLSKKWEKYKLK